MKAEAEQRKMNAYGAERNLKRTIGFVEELSETD